MQAARQKFEQAIKDNAEPAKTNKKSRFKLQSTEDLNIVNFEKVKNLANNFIHSTNFVGGSPTFGLRSASLTHGNGSENEVVLTVETTSKKSKGSKKLSRKKSLSRDGGLDKVLKKQKESKRRNEQFLRTYTTDGASDLKFGDSSNLGSKSQSVDLFDVPSSKSRKK